LGHAPISRARYREIFRPALNPHKRAPAHPWIEAHVTSTKISAEDFEHSVQTTSENDNIARAVTGLDTPVYPARLNARWRPHNCNTGPVTALKIGYARVSTNGQDLTAQREGLIALGVAAENIHVDHGLTGTNRTRPGLREAMAAVRSGDTLVVTKLDRLARSLPDARDIADELTRKGVALSLDPPIRGWS
jgi:hypothetical protein